jgi:hypothetical protein
MEVGILIGVVSLLSVLAVYFWVVRRHDQETQPK